ncbi:putative bifunctional diguanylate cyclase/phosphodiesterase [Pseudonocardia sp. GCM10023141]|uniref:putative bifunctional diguanylate cyclase/phosphodiesterase n=1 Tax=Pseudonocardia sp. GCM10023141 TaxID=3252653 RepID=UPI00360DEEA6
MTALPTARLLRSSGAAAGLGAAVALLVIGGLGAALPREPAQLVANVGVLVLALGGGLGCLRGALRTAGRIRRGWLALAIACWSWGAGQAVWTLYEEVLRVASPYPSLADVGFLGFAVAAFTGLVCLAPPGAGPGTWRRVLDALIVGCAIGLLAWVIALESIISGAGGSPLTAAVSIAYPLADVVLLTVTVLTVAQTRDDPLRWGLLGAGVVAMAASDTAFAYQVAEGTYLTGTIVEWGWRFAFCLFGVAGMFVRRTQAVPDPMPVPGLGSRGATSAGMLPYLPLTAAVVGVGIRSMSGHGLGIVVMLLVVVLVLLVLLRQYVTVLENQQLTRTVEQREVQLHHLAFHDGLTGLANRALFLDRLGHALDLAARSPQPVSVAFIDLDGFKAVNDTLGHAAGDVLLVQVADRLHAALRASDTLARLGGDEFAVLVEQGADPRRVANRLLEAMQEPFHVAERTIAMSASIGVATQEPQPIGATEAGAGAARAGVLLHRADVAMYAVKTAGKGEVGTHSVAADTPGRHAADRSRPLHGAFASALEHGEVQAHYQPVVDPVTGRIAALEALARWTHEGVEIPPATFVPICESLGLSEQLTALMLEQSCAQLARWNAGTGHRRLRVAVNVNPMEFSDTAMPDRIAHLLDVNGLGPGQLALEMTEIALNNRPDTALDVMARLRALGVRLALDDFGTGYSTLSRLARTPVDTVKIDQFFVAHIDHDEQQRQFLRGLLDLTRHLRLRSVAEGVERPGQLHELRHQGCDLVQGHLLGRPATAAQLTPLVLADGPVLPQHLLASTPATATPAPLGVSGFAS